MLINSDNFLLRSIAMGIMKLWCQYQSMRAKDSFWKKYDPATEWDKILVQTVFENDTNAVNAYL